MSFSSDSNGGVKGTSWQETDPIIHIFAQFAWHTEACIVGTPAGLEKLRDAINKALTNNRTECSGTVFVDDGEGYNIIVKPVKEWIDIKVPYTWEEAADETSPHPLSMLTEDEKKRVNNHE